MGIVIDRAATNEGGQFGGDRPDRQPRDVMRQMRGMGADIGDGAAFARLRGIGAPIGLLAAAGPGRASRSCAYSTCTGRMRPGAPSATIRRASRIIG